MKRMKRTVLILAVVLMLVSGAVTAYAMSAETGGEAAKASENPAVQAASTDYAAEEMAVETYYQDLERSQDTEMV